MSVGAILHSRNAGLYELPAHFYPHFMAFGIVIGIGVHIKADHFKPIPAVESYGVLVTALGSNTAIRAPLISASCSIRSINRLPVPRCLLPS